MSMTAITDARNARFQVLITSDAAMLILNVAQHSVGSAAPDGGCGRTAVLAGSWLEVLTGCSFPGMMAVSLL